MANLSHWDHTDAFTGRQAAYLILGVDPSDGRETDRRSIAHIKKKMDEAYGAACMHVHFEIFGEAYSSPFSDSEIESPDELMPVETTLSSNALLSLRENWRSQHDEEEAKRWFNDGNRGTFSEPEFSRTELSRWLTAIGFKSEYSFTKENSSGSMHPREESSLLKMVMGMAIARYEHDPFAPRSKATTAIKADLEKQGITLDEDTIRKHLKRAAKEVPLPDVKGRTTKPN